MLAFQDPKDVDFAAMINILVIHSQVSFRLLILDQFEDPDPYQRGILDPSCLAVSFSQCCGSEIIIFARIRIRFFRKFLIRIRFWIQPNLKRVFKA